MSQYKENLHNIEQIEKKSDSVNDSLDNRFDKFLQQFELSQNTLKEFTKFQSQKEISQLREEIQLSVNISDKEKNYLKDEVSDKDLSSILETAKEIHSEATDHKNSLLEEITQNSELTLLAENKKLLRKIGISDKMMEAAYNPKNAYEHILG
jgi:arsenate reductase-like glutaredoxin family protein